MTPDKYSNVSQAMNLKNISLESILHVFMVVYKECSNTKSSQEKNWVSVIIVCAMHLEMVHQKNPNDGYVSIECHEIRIRFFSNINSMVSIV